MFFRQFLEVQSSTWTYLLADPETRETVRRFLEDGELPWSPR